MKRFLSLTLTALAALTLTACTEVRVPEGHLSRNDVLNMELSPEGAEATNALTAPGTLGDNGYLNILARQTVPEHVRVRVTPDLESTGLHATTAVRFPEGVVAYWLRAYRVRAGVSVTDLKAACLADFHGCALDLGAASHASVDRSGDGAWVIVLAHLKPNVSVRTGH